jgi:hypothetical protein
MTLQEVQAAGRFAWRPGGNLIYVPGEGVLLLLVNEGAVVFDTLRPQGDLPPWALAGWRHERGCPCGCWQEGSLPDSSQAAGTTPNGSGDSGRVRRLLRTMVPHRTRSG